MGKFSINPGSLLVSPQYVSFISTNFQGLLQSSGGTAPEDRAPATHSELCTAKYRKMRGGLLQSSGQEYGELESFSPGRIRSLPCKQGSSARSPGGFTATCFFIIVQQVPLKQAGLRSVKKGE